MKIIFSWEDGNETRTSESELPIKPTWLEVLEYIRMAAKKAYKYSNEKAPEGILKENETL